MNKEEIELQIERTLIVQEKVIQAELDKLLNRMKKTTTELEKLNEKLLKLEEWKKGHAASLSAHQL